MNRLFPIFASVILAVAAPSQATPAAAAPALPTILVVPVENAASVAVVLGVRAGVFDEPDGWNGAAHLVEHLVWHSPAGDVDDPFASLSSGGPLGNPFLDCNAETMWRGTYFYALRPAPRATVDQQARDLADLERTLGVFADMLYRSRFDDATFAAERPRAMAEVRNVAANMQSNPRLRWMFERQARMPKAGTEAEMLVLSREDLIAFQHAHYRPERCVVLIAGRVDEARVRELAEGVFGERAPQGGDAHDVQPLAAKAATTEREAVVHTVPPPAADESRAAAQLAAEVCAQRVRAALPRLRRERPDEADKWRAVTVWVETPADGSLRIAAARRGPGSERGDAGDVVADTKPLEQALQAAARSLATEPPSDKEVRAASVAVTGMLRQRLRSAKPRQVPDGEAGHLTLLQASVDRVLAELAGGAELVHAVEEIELDAVVAAGRRIAASAGGN